MNSPQYSSNPGSATDAATGANTSTASTTGRRLVTAFAHSPLDNPRIIFVRSSRT